MRLFERQAARLAAVLIGAAAVIGACAFVTVGYLRSSQPTVSFLGQKGPVDLTLQTVPSIGSGIHPTWVSYYVKSPSGPWVHSTVWKLPADRTINVTLYEYDSGSPFRNDYWGGVAGTTGGTATLNGKTASFFDPNSTNGIGHSFNVPELGLNVPLEGISGDAKNPCSLAPCATSSDHNTVTFSFKTPPGSGSYRWQCFVPCGLDSLDGNGGPMGTVGYMGGFLQVVPT